MKWPKKLDRKCVGCGWRDGGKDMQRGWNRIDLELWCGQCSRWLREAGMIYEHMGDGLRKMRALVTMAFSGD